MRAIIEADAAIDLQLHTLYSDGMWTPGALIDHLMAEGFALAAITDHDRVDIAPMLQQIAAEKGFRLLVAVEISAHWRGELVDLLCYGFDPARNALQAVARDLLTQQQDNIRQTVAAMTQQGYSLPDAAVHTILEQPAVQQPHLLVDLVRRQGYATPERSAGRLLVESGLKQITVDSAAVVAAAHQSGGVCLIAHPGRGDGYLCFDTVLLDRLRAEVPIDGFEVYYPKHSPEQIAQYRAYAEQHDLLTSAGSDSHTPDHPPIKYRAGWCRKLLERLGIHLSGG